MSLSSKKIIYPKKCWGVLRILVINIKSYTAGFLGSLSYMEFLYDVIFLSLVTN